MMNHEDAELLQQELGEILQGADPDEVMDDMMSVIDSYNAGEISQEDLVSIAGAVLSSSDAGDEPGTNTAPIAIPAILRRVFNVDVKESVRDKDYERLVRMTQVFGKFATTLLGRAVKVDVHNDPHSAPDAPAWSDSESITFNRSKMGKLDTRAVVTSLRGLALHEIAHILMTPRDGTQLVKMVRKANVWQAFNALEDMRIETFMTARYSNVSDWLTATVAEFLLGKPNQIPFQFPLTYGRKYLPASMRIMVRDAYQNPQDIAELEQLIDNYIVLNLSDPANFNAAFAIILRYNELVSNLQDPNGPNGCTPGAWPVQVVNVNGHDARKNGEWKPNNGKPLNKEQQKQILKRIKVNNGKEYDDSAPKPGDVPAPAKPADPASPSESNDGSPVPDSGPGDTGLEELRMDTLKDVLAKVYERRQEEIIDTIRQFNGEAKVSAKHIPVPGKYWRQELRNVLPESVSASRSFGTELEQLRGEYDPYWDRRVNSGRLNVQRYITEHDIDEAFDQWELGREDAVDIECVVLLDISGSMDWCIDNAYQSMWAIKRALDKVNATTTVVAYDTEAYTIYGPEERAGIQMKYSGSGGGTDPGKAIAYANSVLANSERAIKLLISITDGEWGTTPEIDSTVMRLRNAGVLTSLAFISDPKYLKDGATISINNHGHEVAVNITDARDLFSLARRLVKLGSARNLA
jgi:hypothetical protein